MEGRGWPASCRQYQCDSSTLSHATNVSGATSTVYSGHVPEMLCKSWFVQLLNIACTLIQARCDCEWNHAHSDVSEVV